MSKIPPFERGPLSDDPDEVATLLQETSEFLQTTDEIVATEVALHQRDGLERTYFNERMRAHILAAHEPSLVDEIRADKDNVFADELMLSMTHDLPAFLKNKHEQD